MYCFPVVLKWNIYLFIQLCSSLFNLKLGVQNWMNKSVFHLRKIWKLKIFIVDGTRFLFFFIGFLCHWNTSYLLDLKLLLPDESWGGSWVYLISQIPWSTSHTWTYLLINNKIWHFHFSNFFYANSKQLVKHFETLLRRTLMWRMLYYYLGNGLILF